MLGIRGIVCCSVLLPSQHGKGLETHPQTSKRSRSSANFPLGREDILSQHPTLCNHLIAMGGFNNATHLKSPKFCDPDSDRWHHLSEVYGVVCPSEGALPTPSICPNGDFHLRWLTMGPQAPSASTTVTIFDVAHRNGPSTPNIDRTLR